MDHFSGFMTAMDGRHPLGMPLKIEMAIDITFMKELSFIYTS